MFTLITVATEAAVRLALAEGRVLRQYEVARRLGIQEYNDWSTHALLDALIQKGIVSVSPLYILCRGGKVSKRAYRHFFLTPQPRPMGGEAP